MNAVLKAGLALAGLAVIASAVVGLSALNDRTTISSASIVALDRVQLHAAAIGELAPTAGRGIEGREQVVQSMFAHLDDLVRADRSLKAGADALLPPFTDRLPTSAEIDDLTTAVQSLSTAESDSAEAALLEADVAARADALAGRLALVEGAAVRRQLNLDDRARLGMIGTLVGTVLAAAIGAALLLLRPTDRRHGDPFRAEQADPAGAAPSQALGALEHNSLAVDRDGHVRGLGADPGARLSTHVHPDDLDRVLALVNEAAVNSNATFRWWNGRRWRPLLAAVAERSDSAARLVVIDIDPNMSATELDEIVDSSSGTPVPKTAHDLRGAIDGDIDLTISFRPVAPTTNGPLHCLFADAIWRTDTPDGRTVAADELATWAEAAGMGPRLSIWLIEHATQAARRLHREGLAAPIAIRLSPSLLLRDDLVDRISTLLDASDLPASALVIAVPQSALIATPALTDAQLTRIRKLGCAVMVLDVDAVSVRQGLLDGAAADVVALDRRTVARATETGDHSTIAEIVRHATATGLVVAALDLRTSADLHVATAGGVGLGAGPAISDQIVLDDLMNA